MLLGIWLGPHAACWLISIAAFVAAWIALCRKWPIVGYFTVVFINGFVGGLFGYRTRYYRRLR